jgi:type III secretion protein R
VTYLVRYSDHDLIRFFNKVQQQRSDEPVPEVEDHELNTLSLMTLMPAYALSEIQSAFKIAFTCTCRLLLLIWWSPAYCWRSG